MCRKGRIIRFLGSRESCRVVHIQYFQVTSQILPKIKKRIKIAFDKWSIKELKCMVL